jgi:hypothetical protein
MIPTELSETQRIMQRTTWKIKVAHIMSLHGHGHDPAFFTFAK